MEPLDAFEAATTLLKPIHEPAGSLSWEESAWSWMRDLPEDAHTAMTSELTRFWLASQGIASVPDVTPPDRCRLLVSACKVEVYLALGRDVFMFRPWPMLRATTHALLLCVGPDYLSGWLMPGRLLPQQSGVEGVDWPAWYAALHGYAVDWVCSGAPCAGVLPQKVGTLEELLDDIRAARDDSVRAAARDYSSLRGAAVEPT